MKKIWKEFVVLIVMITALCAGALAYGFGWIGPAVEKHEVADKPPGPTGSLSFEYPFRVRPKEGWEQDQAALFKLAGAGACIRLCLVVNDKPASCTVATWNNEPTCKPEPKKPDSP